MKFILICYSFILGISQSSFGMQLQQDSKVLPDLEHQQARVSEKFKTWFEEKKKKRAMNPKLSRSRVSVIEDNHDDKVNPEPYSDVERSSINFVWVFKMASTEDLVEYIEAFGSEIQDSLAIKELFSHMMQWYYPLVSEDSFVSRSTQDWRQVHQAMMRVFKQEQWFAARASKVSRFYSYLPFSQPVWYEVLMALKTFSETRKNGPFKRQQKYLESFQMSSEEYSLALEGLAREMFKFILESYPDPELYRYKEMESGRRVGNDTGAPLFVDFAYQELKTHFPDAHSIHESWKKRLEMIIYETSHSQMIFNVYGTLVWRPSPVLAEKMGSPSFIQVHVYIEYAEFFEIDSIC